MPRLTTTLLACALAVLLSTPAAAFQRAPHPVGRPLAHAAGYLPNDPGRGTTPGGWQTDQWNFTGPYGVNALTAWQQLIDAGRPGGYGTTVAVLDTGLAYRSAYPYRKSPDIDPMQVVRGYDFVSNDPRPYDINGHGTHVASTIAETTNNAIGLTGLAYGVKIMPVRVLDDTAVGDPPAIAKGIRWATDHGADVINLSLEFDPLVKAGQLPDVLAAARYARDKGVVLVGASGNEGERSVSLPARSSLVISVGATTEHGCLSAFSNTGLGLDLVAPGGGSDADLPGDTRCVPEDDSLRDIFQLTLTGPRRDRFGIPSNYEGTSMAAPHVAATAALVLASGVLGPDPTPAAVKTRLEATARDLGVPGPDRRYGAGLLDAAAATAPGGALPQPAPAAPAPAR